MRTLSGLWTRVRGTFASQSCHSRYSRPDDGQLLPRQQLVACEDPGTGTWTADGSQFVYPRAFGRGWVRVRLKTAARAPGWLELYSECASGRAQLEWVSRVRPDAGLDVDFFLYLRHPVQRLRFDPVDVPGRIDLEVFRADPVRPYTVPLHALWRKLRVLWAYGLLTRSLRNGLRLLVSGRLTDVAMKLHGALQDWKEPTAPAARPVVERIPISPGVGSDRNPEHRPEVVYVMNGVGLGGGAKVILEHVSRLHARGRRACVYFVNGSVDWFPRPVPAVQFPHEAVLRRALADFRGIKVATWYQTAAWVAEALRPGDRGYYLVQDIEECYCATPEQAAEVARSYTLGLNLITEGTWVRDELRRRFGLGSVYVGIGLDFDVFRPLSVPRDPNLIVTQARTWSGGGKGSGLKGWETARATVLRCRQANPDAWLATFSVEERRPVSKELAHVHYQSPSDEKLAELYSRAGLFLLTSTHEGFGLTAAEAMACGCPVVATRADGNEEFCIDGLTALTAPAGDAAALARRCVQLQSDPGLAERLSTAARELIRGYTWERVIDRLESEWFGPRPVVKLTPELVKTRPLT